MTKGWYNIKNVLKDLNLKGDVFLSLINEDGQIICVNSCMLKMFHLDNPRLKSINIADIIHPVNLPAIHKQIQVSTNNVTNRKY